MALTFGEVTAFNDLFFCLFFNFILPKITIKLGVPDDSSVLAHVKTSFNSPHHGFVFRSFAFLKFHRIRFGTFHAHEVVKNLKIDKNCT